MFERGLIVAGLSNGALTTISFRTGTWYERNSCGLSRKTRVCSETVLLSLGANVERMCIQHPTDDADNFLYLWLQLSKGGSVQLLLMCISPSEERAGRVRLIFQPPACAQFLQMRTVVLNRSQAVAVGSMDARADEEAEGTPISDSSYELREHARYNQIMMFLYAERADGGSRLRVCVRAAFFFLRALLLHSLNFRAACSILTPGTRSVWLAMRLPIARAPVSAAFFRTFARHTTSCQSLAI